MAELIVLLPTKNEESGLAEVIDRIPKKEVELLGFDVRVVVVDGFSTDSTCEIAESKGCALVLDETHSFGCQGQHGAGYADKLGLAHRVHFRTFGLSKAISARGGVVLGSKDNIEYFR